MELCPLASEQIFPLHPFPACPADDMEDEDEERQRKIAQGGALVGARRPQAAQGGGVRGRGEGRLGVVAGG